MNTLGYAIIIFFARMIDVSIGSIRTVLIVKEKSILASIFAFFEILIWFYAINQTIINNNNLLYLCFYAGGYMIGTFIGTIITKKHIKGYYNVIIISRNKYLSKYLKSKDYGVSLTSLNNKKYLLFVVINKKLLSNLKACILEKDKNAFFIINETKEINNGYNL